MKKPRGSALFKKDAFGSAGRLEGKGHGWRAGVLEGLASGTKKPRVQWDTFESTMGFSIDKHISDYFSKVDINEAKEHKAALEAKQAETATELQRFVTKNYTQFIHISNEIQNIETNMSKLTTMWGNYRSVIKQLQKTTLDFSGFSEPEADGAAGSASELRRSRSSLSAVGGERDDGQAQRKPELIEALCEEVGIQVYQSKYEGAVENIVKARAILKEMCDDIERKLARSTEGETAEIKKMKASVRKLREAVGSQVQSLVAALLGMLQRNESAGVSLSAVSDGGIRIIEYLIRLERSEEALDILLKTRSMALRAEIRAIRFQGDAPQYIRNLSAVVFSGIVSCIKGFNDVFKSNNYQMSAVMQWVLEELEEFVSIFSTQVFEARSNFGQLSKCIGFAFEACRRLDTEGLNLSFVLARRLMPIVKEVINVTFDRILQDMTRKGGTMDKETWLSRKFVIKVDPAEAAALAGEAGGDDTKRRRRKEMKLTPSGCDLYNVVRTLLEDFKHIINEEILPYATTELYGPVSRGVVALLEEVITYQAQMTTKVLPPEREEQHLSILANFLYLPQDLIPRVQSGLASLFKRHSVADVIYLEKKLADLKKMLRRSFCKRRAEYWVRLLGWVPDKNASRYGGVAIDSSRVRVSEEFIQLLEALYRFKDNVHTYLHDKANEYILMESLEYFFKMLSDPTRMKHVDLSRDGLHKLYLDMRFLLKSVDQYLSVNSVKYARSLISGAKQIFCKVNKTKSVPEQSDSWYDEKLALQFKATPPLFSYASRDLNERKRPRSRQKGARAKAGRPARTAQASQNPTPSAAAVRPTPRVAEGVARRPKSTSSAQPRTDTAPPVTPQPAQDDSGSDEPEGVSDSPPDDIDEAGDESDSFSEPDTDEDGYDEEGLNEDEAI